MIQMIKRDVVNIGVGTLVSFDGYKKDNVVRKGIVSQAWFSKKLVPCIRLYRNKEDQEAEGIKSRCYHVTECKNLKVIA